MPKIKNGGDQIPPQVTEGAAKIPPAEEGDDELTKIEIEKSRKIIPEPCSKLCMLENPDDTCLFNKRKYNVSISVGLSYHKMRPVQCISYTGAGPNFVKEDFPANNWLQVIPALSKP